MLKQAIKSISVSRWGIGFIAVIMVTVLSNIRWGKKEYWEPTIASDGKGYYAYLPAVFIYHDLNFGFFENLDRKKYYNENTFYEYRLPYEDKVINKYYCGTAVAQLPFFLMAHAITKATGGDADGYSKWYQIFVGLAALFWLLVGLFYLDNILVLYDVNAWHRLLVLLACVFGTNAFYYTLVEPAMSHIYSFAFVSLFVYLSKKLFQSFQWPTWLAWVAVFAMIVLIRPINGLVICICPFLAEDVFTLRKAIAFPFKKPMLLLFSVLIFAGIIGIQSAVYKVAVGEYWIYSYQNEGFDFSSPHFFEILFSYRKGLFLYTPLLLVSLVGLYFIYKKSPFQVWTWLLFFGFITYVLSSWWMWYYGGSFSGRVYLEYVPLFMILLGVALKEMKLGWRKNLFVALLFLLVVICQVQTYQYRYYQIHWSDMTKEKYWKVFLRPDKI